MTHFRKIAWKKWTSITQKAYSGGSDKMRVEYLSGLKSKSCMW